MIDDSFCNAMPASGNRFRINRLWRRNPFGEKQFPTYIPAKGPPLGDFLTDRAQPYLAEAEDVCSG